jgi:rod shape-determining protein MreB
VISLGGVVTHKSIRVAGNKLDEAIVTYLRRKHSLLVGEQTAEEVKIQIGSALPLKKDESMEVKGRDSVTGLPKVVAVSASQITEAIRDGLTQIVSVVKRVLEDTPPELASDIIDKGVVMSGGTALLRNFDKLLTREIGVAFHVADEAHLCVVRGTGVALENLDLYKRAILRR